MYFVSELCGFSKVVKLLFLTVRRSKSAYLSGIGGLRKVLSFQMSVKKSTSQTTLSLVVDAIKDSDDRKGASITAIKVRSVAVLLLVCSCPVV